MHLYSYQHTSFAVREAYGVEPCLHLVETLREPTMEHRTKILTDRQDMMTGPHHRLLTNVVGDCRKTIYPHRVRSDKTNGVSDGSTGLHKQRRIIRARRPPSLTNDAKFNHETDRKWDAAATERATRV